MILVFMASGTFIGTYTQRTLEMIHVGRRNRHGALKEPRKAVAGSPGGLPGRGGEGLRLVNWKHGE